MAQSEFPWFPFYAERWLLSRSVRLMTLEQRGIYFELLCMAWRDGSIPADAEDLAALLGIDADRMDAAWRRVGKMFQPAMDREGQLVNAWLEEIRTEQNAKRAKQAENGRKGGRPKSNGLALAKPRESDGKPAAVAPSRTQAMVDLMPESHRTPELYDAFRAFFRMRSENKFTSWKPSTMATNAKQFAKFPPEVLIAALAHSTTNQYQGVFPKEFMPGGKHAAKPSKGSASFDWRDDE